MTRLVWLAGFTVIAFLGKAGAAEPSRSTVWGPVTGLRDCPNGGFALPNTSGCIRLTGNVAAETSMRTGAKATPPSTRARLFSGRTEGRLAADVRVETGLGPARAYVSLKALEPFGSQRR